MITARSQVTGGDGKGNVSNSSEVLEMLESYKNILILQGHIHWKEYGFVNDRIQFITGGSIAGDGWKGRRHNTREGFVLLKVTGGEITWEYIDHGWEVERLKNSIPVFN